MSQIARRALAAIRDGKLANQTKPACGLDRPSAKPLQFWETRAGD